MKKLPDINNIEIQKKLARLAAFTELNPRPIIEIDVAGKILDVNSSARHFFPDLQKKGRRHPYLADLQSVVSFLKQEKKPFRREIKIKKTWFKQIFYYVPSFNLIHIYGSDVTERKQVEQNLRESEKKYHMLFEKMNYGYALQDIIFDDKGRPTDYRFVDVNPAFEKLSNVKKEQILQKTTRQLSVLPMDVEDKKQRLQYDQVALTGKPMFFESYNKKLDKYFEMYTYRPNEKQIALIFSDISRLKKIDVEKNNFISIMSHELRNPLTPIMANAQFIKSIIEKRGLDDAVLGESLNIIENQSKIMADLLNDILDVSRLSRQRIQLKKTRVDVCEAVKSAVKSSVPFINIKRQKLAVFLPKKQVVIQADPLRLEQILVNIINNASKYTEPLGRIEVRCYPTGNQVRISVKDNGIGMSADKITKVFELFNDDSQPFMGIGGLGIGLNIVKNLVSMHGGTTTVTSRGKNKGAEFIVTLPLGTSNKKFAPVSKKSPAAPASSAGKRKKHALRVLVVDDNEDIRTTLSKILDAKGFEVKSARNGAQAIKISKSFKPHTALIDIGLPDMKGYDVARELKKQNTSAHQTKLIAFSGYGQEKDKILAKEAGFHHHLTKPVDINKLIELL